MIVTKEQILFESYINSIGYSYQYSKVYMSKRSSKFIAEIEFSENEIVVKGYGYPSTVTKIAKQIEYLFGKNVNLVFEGDFPRFNIPYCY